MAETDFLLAALPQLRLAQQRNWFCNLTAAYIALHILFNQQTSPMRLCVNTTKVSFVFYLTSYLEVHAHNPFFDNPFITWKSLPYLLGNPSFVSWRKFPSTLVPGWLYTEPPSPSPFPLSPSNSFPCSNACPLKTTLRYRLHIVRYTTVEKKCSIYYYSQYFAKNTFCVNFCINFFSALQMFQ